MHRAHSRFLTLALTALLSAGVAAGCGDNTQGTDVEADTGRGSGGAGGGGRPSAGGGNTSDGTSTIDPDSSADDDATSDDGAALEDDTAGGSDTQGSADGGGPDTGADVDSPPPLVRGPALGVDPTSLFFSATLGDPPVREIVEMTNIGDEPFTIYEAFLAPGSAPNFRLIGEPNSDLVMNPGDFAEFGVFFDAVGLADAEGEIHIRHSISTEPFVIPLVAAEKGGEVNPPPSADPPCVRVLPATLDFGRVPRGGAPVGRTFDITNCGATEIRVQRLDRASVLFFPTPANFQWTSDPLPMTLAPGEVRTVNVTYEAGRAGVQTGAIDVRTNVPGRETVKVNLRATAEPPPISDLDLHLVLNWDVDGGSDVDFHFLRNPGAAGCNDCYFSNMEPDWGVAGNIIDNPFLDYDDLEGPGPENINVDELADGTYRIIVHYYSDTGSGGGSGGPGGPTNATVEVWIGGTLRATYGPQRLARTGDTWTVADLDWPSETLTPINTMRSSGAADQCR